jgi:hypothetical protein
MSRPQHGPPIDATQALGFIHLVLSSLAYASELLVRKNGSFCGIIVVPMVMIIVSPPHYGAEYILWHAVGMMLAAFLHRRQRRINGVHIHRHYIGTPRIGGAKRWGEFFLGLLIAFAFIPVCDTLVIWHLLGTISSRIEIDYMFARERRIRDRMRDAQIEAAHYSSSMRDESY